MKVYIDDIRLGKGERNKYTYATLHNAENGEMIISATLDYILTAIRERDYQLLPTKPDLTTHKTN